MSCFIFITKGDLQSMPKHVCFLQLLKFDVTRLILQLTVFKVRHQKEASRVVARPSPFTLLTLSFTCSVRAEHNMHHLLKGM